MEPGGNLQLKIDGVAYKGWTPAAKAAIWTKIDKIATSWEKPFADAARKALNHDKREVLGLVGEAKALSKARKATVDYNQLKYDIDEYLRTNGEEYWRELFTPLIEGVVADQGQEWASVLGMEFDVRNLAAESWFQQYALQFAQPITQTSSDGIHAVVEQGLAEGWAIPTMQGHIEQLFTQWMNGGATAEEFAWYSQRLPPHRTEMIARTETMHASNAGSFNQMSAWHVSFKGWLASIDGRERDTHRIATMTYDEGGSVGVIPMSTPFMVGGHPMQHPGDSSMGAPISEIANCRCTILPYTEKPIQKPGEGINAAQDYAGPVEYRAYAGPDNEIVKPGEIWKDGLSEEEFQALKSWTEIGYKNIAGNIRKGVLTDTEQAFISGVEKAPLCSQITYMGEGNRRLNQQLGLVGKMPQVRQQAIEDFWRAMIGTTYVIPAAKSGSLAAYVASGFTSGDGYILQIKSNRGRWINPANWRYKEDSDEQEVHFLEKTELRIVDVQKVEVLAKNQKPGQGRDMLVVVCEDVTGSD